MADLVTVGTFVAGVLSTVGGEVLKGVVGESVKDSYKKLKEFIAPTAGQDLAALEQALSSPARQAVISEVVDALEASEQAEAHELATALLVAFETDPARSIGVDVKKIKTLQIELDSIKVSGDGVGARFGNVEAGAFKVGPIEVGLPPGKSPN